jgi:YidC/Oxa1 family membrane protein insertase
MPNVRITLWGIFAAILFLNYTTWMQDNTPRVAAQSGASSTAPNAAPPANTLGDSVPQAASSGPAPTAQSGVPAVPAVQSPSSAPASATVTPPTAAAEAPVGTPLHVTTDVLDIGINLKGGELNRADLVQYPLRKDTPNIPVRLLSYEPAPTLYLLQSGLTGGAGETAPTHLATWTSEQKTFTLAPGADELRVPLAWTDGQGLTVTKTFIFKRGQYGIGLEYDVKNDSTSPRKLASYAQFLRHWEHASRSYFDVESYSFKGPAVSDGAKSKDLNVENDSDSKFSANYTNGWLASLQHQFVSAIVPPAGQPYQYQLKVVGNEYLITATGPIVDVPAGAKVQFREQLFIGPKLQSQLGAIGRNLERTVDFGNLTILAQPLFTGLAYVHKVIGNWGWSIIIVTALIKLLFYPLSQASGRSMAKMRTVSPRMKQIPWRVVCRWSCRSRYSSRSTAYCWKA